MSLNITQTEINTLWDKGYRPFEIYTSNPEPVMYHGKMEETNVVGGWDIKHIFATRDEIEKHKNNRACFCFIYRISRYLQGGHESFGSATRRHH